jgi:hypothetical protein
VKDCRNPRDHIWSCDLDWSALDPVNVNTRRFKMAPHVPWTIVMDKSNESVRTYRVASTPHTEGGPESAGQSGDTQGLSDTAEAGAESVKELIEEGQFFEAEVTMGVENAPDADVAEVHVGQESGKRRP